MRCCLLVLALPILLVAAALAWPYQLEHLVGRVIANPTGCTVDVQNYSGWKGEWLVPGIRVERVADAYAFVYDCKGMPGGKPAAAALRHAGVLHVGEGCGVASPREHVCRVRLPVVPQRYRLMVGREAGGPVQAIDLEVQREREWRFILFDALMSV